MIRTKRCSNCNEVKLLSDFGKHSTNKDGKQFSCKSCRREYYENNREKIKAKSAKYRRDNKEKIAAWAAKHCKDNKEKIAIRKAKYYEDNKEKIKYKVAKYRRDNKEKISASVARKKAKRRAAQLNATPIWLTKDQLDEIKNIYDRCRYISKQTGIIHHVDHIVPLKGKNVRGLHVPWNLQVITATENLSKGNRYD